MKKHLQNDEIAGWQAGELQIAKNTSDGPVGHRLFNDLKSHPGETDEKPGTDQELDYTWSILSSMKKYS